MSSSITAVGGVFSILTFMHFLVDFGTQSEKEAMVKHKDIAVRTKHCFIYALAWSNSLFL